MVKHEFEKQPWESWYVGVDFSGGFSVAETIKNPTSSFIESLPGPANETYVFAVDKKGDLDNSVLVDGSPVLDGKILKVRVQGGSESLSPYKITFRAISNQHTAREKDVQMRIKDY